MDKIIEQMLEAHVQHELARLKAGKIEQTIRDEVAAIFQWLKTVSVREIVAPEQLLGIIARIVVELPVSPEIADLAGIMSRRVLTSKEQARTAFKDICPRTAYDAAVAKVGGMHSARAVFIHRLVSSSVYTAQISEALYTGIKEYLLTENILAQKVPGLASLIKFGKFAVNKTMGPLEAAVEKTVKSYIEANLGNTLRRSEKSINDHFSEAHINELGGRIWDDMASARLSDYAKFIDNDDMDDFVALGLDFWLHFRKSRYFVAISTDLVHAFYQRHGDTKLSQLAAKLGVSQKLVVNELLQVLVLPLQTAAASGFLAERIRTRLASFYGLPQTAKLISAWANSASAPAVTAVTATPVRKRMRVVDPADQPKTVAPGHKKPIRNRSTRSS